MVEEQELELDMTGDCPRCGLAPAEVVGFNVVDPVTGQEGSVPLLRCSRCGWQWWNL